VRVGELGRRRVERTEDFVLARADAVLEGRVREGAGFPVRGAEVAVVRRDRFQGQERATTDEHGRFTITDLARGKYPVTVTHEDFPPLDASGTTGEPLELTLPFGGGIAAQVRDAGTLAPVAGARVTAAGPRGARAEARSGDQGEVDLAPLSPGAWKLEIDAPGYVALTQTVDVPAGSKPGAVTVHDLRIPLARGATIGGTVIDGNGQRVRGAKVTAHAERSAGEAGAESKHGPRSATTDELGRFRMTDVPTGALTIQAARDELRGTLDVQLGPGDEQVTLQITIQ
jgi:protocatechuate 3,4-dioxygenase beta subunit